MNDKAIHDLLAKQEITEVLHNYCRAMDRIDDDLGRSVFHPDAIADYGTMYRGSGSGFIDYVHDTHTRMLVQSHQVGNISIRIEGDRAGSETYVTAALRMKGEGDAVLEIVSRGRYIDRWERRDGRWAISHRRYLHLMDEVRPVQTTMHAAEGSRDRSDPSYAVLSMVESEVA